MKCRPIAKIIPDTPVPAIMPRMKVRGVDCKIVSNVLSQTTNGQTIADIEREAWFGGQSSEDRREFPRGIS